MLKVSPWKGVIRFGKRGKLNPRYIGPFKILAKVGTVAYRLELPEKLSRVHSTFHVSNLKKCLSDEPLAIPLDGNSTVDEKSVGIQEEVPNIVRDPGIQTQTQTEIETQTQYQTNGDDIVEESPEVQVEPETNATFNFNEVKLDYLICDPSLRPPISSYPVNQQDEIRRTFIRLGPYQLVKSHYPLTHCGPHKRSFQATWFKRFWWLEYSDKNDVAFCFPCYLFGRKPIERVGSDTFTLKGFNSWRKVNGGKHFPFVSHEGKIPASAHNFSVKCYDDLKNKVCHIENIIDKQTEQEIMDNRLRLKVTSDSTKWLILKTCPLRGSDERPTLINRGNYLEHVKLIASYNLDMARVVLEKAPQNAKYTSLDIQKELLQMFAIKVQEAIRDEIGMARFCLIVDESKKEKMSIVVRFLQLALVAASKDVSELEHSDNINIPDADPINAAMEASILLKFDMHLYKSSLNETPVKWLTKCYKTLADLWPRIIPEGMTMNELPPDAIGLFDAPTSLNKWKNKFFLLDRRAAPIAMPYRYHDSSVADPFPRSEEFNESEAGRLREVVITLHKPPASLLYANESESVLRLYLRSMPIFCMLDAGLANS
ncbi:zinc finger MYM-type protein 1-like protein [Tanacetum coccineum]